MKRKAAMMLAMLLVVGVTFSTAATATEVENAVSGNEISVEIPEVEEPVEVPQTSEEPGTEEPVVEDSETEEIIVEGSETEETVGEEPTAEAPTDEEVDITAPAGGEPETEEENEKPVEEEKKVSGGGALAVDGYFDDWEGVPETKISYGSHNTDGTVYEYHGGAILVSGGYVYVHIRMSDYYQQQIPVDDLKLTINGVEKSFIIRKRNTDKAINWSPEIYELSPGIHSDLGIFYRDGGSVALGEAAVTISEAAPNDSFEFRIKISELEQLYGFEPGTIENGAKLEFYSPNIGPEKITVVGSSTGTYIGILLCFAVVLSALLGQKRKQGLS